MKNLLYAYYMPGTAWGIFTLNPHFNTAVWGLRCLILKVGKLSLRKVKKLTQGTDLCLNAWFFYFINIKTFLCCFFWFPLSSWLDFLSLKRQILVFAFGLILLGCPFLSEAISRFGSTLKGGMALSYSWPGDQVHSVVGEWNVLDPNS